MARIAAPGSQPTNTAEARSATADNTSRASEAATATGDTTTSTGDTASTGGAQGEVNAEEVAAQCQIIQKACDSVQEVLGIGDLTDVVAQANKYGIQLPVFYKAGLETVILCPEAFAGLNADLDEANVDAGRKARLFAEERGAGIVGDEQKCRDRHRFR